MIVWNVDPDKMDCRSSHPSFRNHSLDGFERKLSLTKSAHSFSITRKRATQFSALGLQYIGAIWIPLLNGPVENSRVI